MKKTCKHPKIPRWWVLLSAAAFLTLTCAPPAHTGTVMAPYANDFSVDVSDFTALPAAKWWHVADAGVYSNDFADTKSISTMGVTVSNMGGSQTTPFTFAADFVLVDGNGSGTYAGVKFLAETDAFPGSNGYTFHQVFAPSGNNIDNPVLYLSKNGTVVAEGPSFMQLRNTKNVPLRFIVYGVYVDTNSDDIDDALDITCMIVDVSTGQSASIAYRDTEPLTGAAFGTCAKNVNNNAVSIILWDSFSISDEASPPIREVAMAPYENDFTGDVSAFTVWPFADWMHFADAGVFSNNFEKNVGTIATTVPNIGGPHTRPFTFTAGFTILSGAGSATYMGACLLSGSERRPNTDGYRVYQRYATGTLVLSKNNDDVASGASFGQFRYLSNVPLRIIVKGVYVDTDADGVDDALDLTCTLMRMDTGVQASITYRDTEPLTGQVFGMMASNANNGATSLILWDYFSITDDTPKGTRFILR